jgi:sterol desaturase/sphingolipid hydroxylase (fatty acid hydroxylase superfamily)
MLNILLPIATYLLATTYYMFQYDFYILQTQWTIIMFNLSVQFLLHYLVEGSITSFEMSIFDIPGFLTAICTYDILFGTTHVLMHKIFYNIHAVHHSLQPSDLNGANGQYSHVLEHLMNLFSVYMAPKISPMSSTGLVVWYMFVEYNSVYSHIDFTQIDPIKPKGYHILHHYYPRYNYGTSIGLFDYYYGSRIYSVI